MRLIGFRSWRPNPEQERRAAALRRCALFDECYYRDHSADVRAAGIDPALHYVCHGAREGRRTHPLFDPIWYRTQQPDAEASGLDPLTHYLEIGGAAGSDPNWCFDGAWYAKRHPEAAARGLTPLEHYVLEGEARGMRPHPLFDPGYYRAQHPDLVNWEGPLLAHFLEFGALEGRCAHPLFDGRWYRLQHPEVDESGLEPMRHWLRVGGAAGFDPHPLFDTSWYRAQQPDAEASGLDPLTHYLEIGGAAGSDPNWCFDGAWYAKRHPEAAARGLTPLEHYVLEGEARGMRPHPLFDPGYYRAQHPDLVNWEGPLLAHFLEFGAIEGRCAHLLFDGRWYRLQHPEVDESGLGPMRHWLRVGGAAGFDPHPLFDTSWYRGQQPDAEASGFDPLTHYLEVGAPARSSPHPLLDARWYARENPDAEARGLTPLEHYVLEGEARGVRPNPLFAPDYYREQNPDLRQHPVPLLAHYAKRGWRECRRPHPLFDPTWYPSQPAVAGLRGDPLAHWLHEGRAAGADPHPLLDAQWYRAQHPELEEETGDPLAHWEAIGARAGFDPHPFFDTAWYRTYHVSAFDAGADPLRHYCEEGHLHGWLPNPFFDPDWYLTRYRIQLRPRETPLTRFARDGAIRGHRPGPLFDFCARFLRDSDPEREAESPLAGWSQSRYRRLSVAGAGLAISLPDVSSPRVSVVVPAFGPISRTLACLRSIGQAETRASYEVIVVDDEPGRGLHSALRDVAFLRWVCNARNEGFVESCNRGAREARGEELVFLNNDTLVTDGWLDQLLATREAFPEAGIIGPKLLYPNGRLQEAGGIVFRDGHAANFGLGGDPSAPGYDTARPVDYVSGAALLIRRELFEELGGFDPVFRPAFYEDTDLCFRVRTRGLATVYQPGSVVIHFGGASYGHDSIDGLKRHQVEHRDVFLARWADALEAQPASTAEPEEAALGGFRRFALVLDATTITPDQDSGSLRMFHVLGLLRRAGYHVTFIPHDLSRPEQYVRRLRAHGIEAWAPPHLYAIDEVLERIGWRIDLAILSRPDVAERWMDPVRLLCPRATILYDTVDLHFLRRDRELALRGDTSMTESPKQAELEAARRADATLVVSDADREQLLAEDPRLRVHVLSNIHELHPTTTPFCEREGVLFIGGFRHAPNVDAIQWFVAAVLPLIHREIPDLRLHVVGSAVPDEVRALASDRVVIEGYVPDVQPLFARCRLSVAPLRYGAGVKGKVNQSMSFGVPCVLTTIAAEGMELVAGEDALVADDAEAFAAEVVRLYRDESLWKRLAEGSLRNIERVFSVAVAEKKLHAILAEHGQA
ncbi:MAG: glycosyltransferase [Myxococcota bacterium]|nr:glycosyltransferase [Myxococcota bacterium]